MKSYFWIFLAVGVAVSAVVSGCGKKSTEAPQQQGVTLDLPKLKEAFATASPEAQAAVDAVLQGARYGEYGRAFAALEKLAAMPNLTEAQKTLVGQVTEQLKQIASKASTAVAPPR